MRIAYFEPIGGAAGDMIIGSLLDVGLRFEDLRAELSRLPLGGYQLRYEHVRKSGLGATQLSVEVEGQHTHEADRPSMPRGPSIDDVVALISKSEISESVKRTSFQIFEALAAATAKVEGVPVGELRFDPAGVVDSVVDVVGSVLGLDLLGVEQVYCSTLPIFKGTMVTGHGPLALPAPAALELLVSVGAPMVTTSVRNVQVTATGAAILTTIAAFREPIMSVDRVGCGAGEADLDIPNVVRVSLGHADQPETFWRRRSVRPTNSWGRAGGEEMNVSD
jgi:uncharacterized protein (DUF111 family)